jgi:predicted nucleic acid-binding protein
LSVVVLDASVLVACLFKDGRARHVLLHSSDVRFVAPPDLLVESERQIPKVAQRAGITSAQVRATLQVLRGRVHEVPISLLRPAEAEARNLAKNAGDENDWEYVALALTLDAPIWTCDDDLRRVKAIRTVGTARVLSAD